MNADKSSVIEEAIARLKFDGTQFASGVTDAIGVLDRLKMSVNNAFTGIANTRVISNLTNAMGSFTASTSGMEKGITTISNRFSGLGLVGTTVISELTRKAVNFGLSLGNKVLSPLQSIWGIIKNKGWARASNVKQAEFMIKNLGLAWEKAKPDIDDAVNGTRFGFDEAATAAAQLATSGIKFGEDMPDVLKAIGNVASMTNTEFSDMAHIFTTMASNGRVYGEQLQQMSYRGLNATKSLADYLGKTEAQVKDMVSDGKVSFKDFYMAMNETFGDAAFKANETFSGVLANNKAVFARIGQVYASGFMDAAKVVLQHTQPKLKEIEKAIKPIGEAASSAMMAVAKMITPIVDRINVKPIIYFIDKYVTPLKEKIDGIIDKINGVQNAAKQASMTAEELLEMANKVIRGDYGNGQERRDKLEELGYSYERIQNKVNELLGCSFRYEVEEEDVADAEKKASDAALEHTENLSDLSTIVFNLTRFLNGLKGAWEMVKQAGVGVYKEVIKPLMDNLPNIIGIVAKVLGDFGDQWLKLTNWVRKVDPFTRIVHAFIGISKVILEIVGDIGGAIFGFIKEITGSKEFGAVIKDIADGIEKALIKFTHIGGYIRTFMKHISELKGVVRLSALLNRAFTKLRKGVIDVIVGLFGKLHEEFNKENGFNLFETLGKFFFDDDGVIDKVANFLAIIGETIEKGAGFIHGALFGERGIVTMTKKLFSAIGNLTQNADIVPASFKNLFDHSLFENIKTVGGSIIEFFGGIVEKIKSLGELEGVQKLAKAFSTLFGVIKKEAIELLGKALEQLDKLLGSNMFKNNEFINFFGEGGVIDTVTGILSRFVEELSNAPSYIENFAEKVGELPSKFGSVGETIQKIFTSGKKLFEKASGGPSSFLDGIVEQIKPDVALGSIGEDIKAIFELLGGKFVEGLKENFQLIFDIVSDFGDLLQYIKGDAQEASGGLEKLKEIVESLEKTTKPYVDYLTEKLPFLNNLTFKDVMSGLENLGKVGLLFKAGGVLKNISKMFKSITEDIKKVGETIDAFKKIPENISGIFAGIKDGFVNLSGALKNWGDVKKVFKEMRKKPLTTSFRDFAIAIGILVGAFALLGSPLINYEKIKENAGVIMSFVSVVAAFVAMMALIPPPTVELIGNFFSKLGAGLLMLTVSVAIFGHMKTDTLTRGGTAILALCIILSGAARIAGSANPGGFIGLAAAVFMLVPTIWLFGHMDPETLIQGGLAVLAFTMSMAKAASIASGAKTGAFVGMAVGLLLLVPTVWLFGHMNPETVVKGGLTIVSLMMSMALAARIASGAKGAFGAFAGAAIAMATLTGCMLLLSLVRTDKLLANAAVINTTLIILTYCFKTVSGAKFKNALPNLLLMVAAFAAISVLLAVLANLGLTGDIVAMALGLSALIGVLALSIKLLSSIDPKGAGQAALAIGAFSTVVAAIIGVIAAVLGYFGTTEKGIELAHGLGAIIRAFFDGLKGDEPEKAEQAEQAADKLSAFSEKIESFISMLTSVDEGTARAADLLATAILKMTGAELLSSLSDFVQSKFVKDETMGAKLVSFGESLNTFLETTAGIETGEGSHFQEMTSAIDSLVEIANKLEPMGGILQDLIGGPDLSEFGNQLAAFVTGFTTFNDGVNAITPPINTARMELIATGCEYMANLAGKIQNGWSALAFVIGRKNLGQFGEELGLFIQGFIPFNTRVNLMKDPDKEKIQNISDALEPIIEMSGKLQRGKSILGFIIGRKDLGEFGKNLGDLAIGMNTFAVKAEGVNVTQMSAVINALHRLTDFEGAGTTINADTVSVINAVVTLATSLNAWTQYAADFDPVEFIVAVNAMKKLAEFFATLDGVDAAAADTFGAAMVTLAMTDTAAFCSAFTDAADDAKLAVGIFLDGAKAGLEDAEKTFKTSGENAATGYGTGITAFTEPVKKVALAFITSIANAMSVKAVDFIIPGVAAARSFAKGISQNEKPAYAAAEHLGTNALSALNGLYDDFYKKGQDAGQGYADGLEDKMNAAVRVAERKAQDALDKIASVNDSNSPSKETRKLGTYFSDGYALGIEDTGYKATDAARDVASATLMAMMLGMQKLSDLIDEDLNSEPVIRPVFDPTGVIYGIGQTNALIDDMTGDMTYGMGSRISNAQNGEAERARKYSELDYTKDMATLIDNTTRMINAIRENRYAIIDGDYMFDYVDTRMGQA